MDDAMSSRRTRAATSRRAYSLLVLVVAMLSAAALPACSGPQTADDEQAKETPEKPDRPGTDRWEGGALELPARSPIVATVRIGSLLDNARGLRRWLLEEPQMFGPDGESFTRGLRQGWSRLASAFGGDPLSDQGPKSVGIDVDRPLHLGVYPADAVDGAEFVDRIEGAVRSELELDADERMVTAMREVEQGDRELPNGFHKRVTDRLDGLRPQAGFRIVVPVDDPGEFLDNLEQAASFAAYEEVEVPKLRERYGAESAEAEASPYQPTRRVEAFANLDNRWPVVAVRTNDKWAKIDALFQEFHLEGSQKRPGVQQERLVGDLRDMIREFEAGRSTAPRPADSPFLAVSADQRATAEFAKMQAYKQVLETVSSAGVDKRNRAFAEGLERAATIGEQWSTAAETLTGVSYGLHGVDDGSGKRYARLAMSLFGPAPRENIELATGGRSLGVDERAVGMSADLDPLFSENWDGWLGVDQLTDLVGESSVATDYPTLYLLSIPRNFALFTVNADSLIEETLPEPLGPLFERRRDLQRLEVATSGARLQSLRRDPELVGLLTFDRRAATDDIDLVLEALPTLMTLGLRVGSDDAADNETLDRAQESFARDELEAFPLPDGHPARPFHYYAHTRGDEPFVFFSRGIERAAAEQELEELLAGERRRQTADALSTRIEPAALTSLLTSYDPDAMDPVQPGILAQRLGALELTIQPERREDLQMLHYQIDLRKPPEL
jgi:hypothetical protein